VETDGFVVLVYFLSQDRRKKRRDPKTRPDEGEIKKYYHFKHNDVVKAHAN